MVADLVKVLGGRARGDEVVLHRRATICLRAVQVVHVAKVCGEVALAGNLALRTSNDMARVVRSALVAKTEEVSEGAWICERACGPARLGANPDFRSDQGVVARKLLSILVEVNTHFYLLLHCTARQAEGDGERTCRMLASCHWGTRASSVFQTTTFGMRTQTQFCNTWYHPNCEHRSKKGDAHHSGLNCCAQSTDHRQYVGEVRSRMA
mmetsp:Transcript_28233/g.53006  ORF Transcript_28233/g.53006 Transcript_28233/m.53006 type:complete len:209 (-) Transcript_28233:14-640(-)